MDKAFSTPLHRFVGQISQCCSERNRQWTINDLILGIRNERLTELSAWSIHELDLFELHASRFSNNDPLDSVFSSPVQGNSIADVRAVASICSPSPLAWT